jgi:DNA-binding transcriptional ArsR family regulator
VDPRLVKALDHILRQHILLAAVAGEVSPIELSKALDEGLSQVSYHVKVLRDDCDGMIEETRTEPRRGAVEHYYRASAKTLFPAKAWRKLKKGCAPWWARARRATCSTTSRKP